MELLEKYSILLRWWLFFAIATQFLQFLLCAQA
jgi:hypothetical protein